MADPQSQQIYDQILATMLELMHYQDYEKLFRELVHLATKGPLEGGEAHVWQHYIAEERIREKYDASMELHKSQIEAFYKLVKVQRDVARQQQDKLRALQVIVVLDSIIDNIDYMMRSVCTELLKREQIRVYINSEIEIKDCLL